MSMSYLISIMDGLSDMVRIVNREGRILLTNKAYDRKMAAGQPSTGQACYALLGRDSSCEDCVTCDSGPRRGQVWTFNDRRYSVNITPLFDEAGEMTSIMEVFRDITLDSAVRENLISQNVRMGQDLRLAHKLQAAFTNMVAPTVPGYETAVGYQACDRVSGDMFDFIVRGDKLIMYVADVSGHGVVASMLSIFFSRAVDTACKLGFDTPERILDHVQQEFNKLQVGDDMYITGFVVVLDIPTGDIAYANAGLSVTPVIAHGGEIRELFMGALPISSWTAGRKYRQQSDHLEPGDRLLLYSDGIPEVQIDPQAQKQFYDLFSEEPFSASEFLYKVRRDFVTRRQDDLTMLILERWEDEARV